MHSRHNGRGGGRAHKQISNLFKARHNPKYGKRATTKKSKRVKEKRLFMGRDNSKRKIERLKNSEAVHQRKSKSIFSLFGGFSSDSVVMLKVVQTHHRCYLHLLRSTLSLVLLSKAEAHSPGRSPLSSPGFLRQSHSLSHSSDPCGHTWHRREYRWCHAYAKNCLSSCVVLGTRTVASEKCQREHLPLTSENPSVVFF